MRYLLDTNFISELRKGERANRGVQAWSLSNDPALCALSVATVAEIRMGIERCRPTDPDQARVLEQWLGTQIMLFGENLLPITRQIAERWGRLLATVAPSERDLLIAVTALDYDLTVITRNIAHFESTGVRVLNPWK